MTKTNKQAISMLDLRKLRLDPENPRLPEYLLGKDSEVILEHLYESESLDEIARSMVDNGFFPHEPLIVEKQKGELYKVLEGNRRLATLMVLHRLHEVDDLSFPDLAPSKPQLSRLTEIPCFIVGDDGDAHSYLGFRHIGGIKTWSAEAKARYLYQEVEKSKTAGSDDPFRDVGRRVGSNAMGVRNAYIALAILIHLREETDVDTHRLQQHRFGVWTRCLNSSGVLSYIEWGGGKTYEAIKSDLQGINLKSLAEVISDLSPNGGNAAILQDSRDVTVYGSILSDSRALAALRKTNNFSVAAEIVEVAGLAARIQRIALSVETLNSEVTGYSEVDEETVSASDRLANLSKSLWQLTRAKALGDGT